MHSLHSKVSLLTEREMRAAVPLECVRSESPADDDVEETLRAVDPELHMAELIAMPLSIREPLRSMIVAALGARFEFYDDLEAWLSAPSVVLGGEAPFERVALGDGEAVLLALGIAAPTTTLLASRRDLAKRVVMSPATHRPSRNAVARRGSHKR